MSGVPLGGIPFFARFWDIGVEGMCAAGAGKIWG